MTAGYDDLSESNHILLMRVLQVHGSLVISPIIGTKYYTYSGCDTLHKDRHVALCMGGPVPKK
jgi:hypothetical protein